MAELLFKFRSVYNFCRWFGAHLFDRRLPDYFAGAFCSGLFLVVYVLQSESISRQGINRIDGGYLAAVLL